MRCINPSPRPFSFELLGQHRPPSPPPTPTIYRCVLVFWSRHRRLLVTQESKIIHTHTHRIVWSVFFRRRRSRVSSTDDVPDDDPCLSIRLLMTMMVMKMVVMLFEDVDGWW